MKLRLRVTAFNGVCAFIALGAFPSLAAASWADKCATAPYICVDIAVTTTGQITLSDPTYLQNPPNRIIWRLPEGYVFGYRGGGAYVASVDEISEPTTLGDDDTDTQQLAKRYKVKAKKLRPPGQYKYTLTFDEMNGGMPTRRFTCDPTIANSGSLDSPRSKGKVPRPLVITQCTVTAEP